ncbi:serine hydrolase domain-containing protein [uncultured Aquimarina sp.]|uniref:serine hydrolase domain-containing protein n=1 Tax=uncultured Aquimarina sp. TaxID=575652 RepID=UPI002605B9FF|nr:serine hydrolase domain-containing protein [uncultured Aquimarina sp.]
MKLIPQKYLHFFLSVIFFSSISSCNNRTKKTSTNIITSFSGQSISFSEMDQFLESQMDSIGIPGLSIAIINDAKIVYHRALGLKDVDTQEKLNEKTLFDAGSTSKTPFAYLALKMVDQGILDLDTPLYTYLPYPDIAHDERYKLITARMVLSHTSGFPNWRFFNEDGKLDIKFTPGTGFKYSGEGFEYLADVLAHLKNIERNDLQKVFEKEIAIPLNMHNAYYVWNNYVTKNRASGHFEGKVNPGWGANKKKPDFRASYSLQTEAVSYAGFIIGLMQEKGLEKNTFDEMFKVHVENPEEEEGEDQDNRSWALGMVVNPTIYGPFYGHSGGNLSFTCEYQFSKEKKIGYVFFTNSEFSTELDEKLVAFLMKK